MKQGRQKDSKSKRANADDLGSPPVMYLSGHDYRKQHMHVEVIARSGIPGTKWAETSNFTPS